MRNFYLDGLGKNRLIGEFLHVSADDRHHIECVLRLGNGDQVNFLDGEGHCYKVELQGDGQQLLGKILESRYVSPVQPKITLFQGLPKFNKMQQIVRQSTEVGVDRIVPMICERSIPKYNSKSIHKKVSRWQKISDQSARQSCRYHFINIDPPMNSMSCLTEGSNFDLAILFYELESKFFIRSIINQKKTLESVALFVGPEGGFTIDEVERAKAHGILTASLGHNILRTETAPIVAVSLLVYELRQKDGYE